MSAAVVRAALRGIAASVVVVLPMRARPLPGPALRSMFRRPPGDLRRRLWEGGW